MIRCSEKERENNLRKSFRTKEKETRISVNQPLNNWFLVFLMVLHITLCKLFQTFDS